MKPFSRIAWAALALLQSSLPAAVLITEFTEPRVIFTDFTPVFEAIDLDSNGTMDFTLGSDLFGTAMRTELANRVIIRLDGGRDIGGPITPIPIGQPIGLPLGPGGAWPLLWASSDFLGGYVSPGEIEFTGIVFVANTGSSTDFSGRAPIGVEFAAEDGIHYGFLDITAGPGYRGITFHGFAYETQPGVPIIAGAVPEPSTLLLLISGIAMPLCRRWRRPAPELRTVARHSLAGTASH